MELGELELLWLANFHAILMSDCCELNLIKCFLVVNEHDLGADLYKLSSLGLCHIWSPILSEDDSTIMHTESCNEVVLLELHAKNIGTAEENFTLLPVDARDDCAHLNWVTLHSFSVLVLPNVVVVLSRVHKQRTVILNAILFIFSV